MQKLSLYRYTLVMPRGSQEPATGLAKQFQLYVRMQMSARGISSRELAKQIGMSHSYVATRLRGEMPFNVRDVEAIARVFGVPVNEVFLRAQFELAADYEGRLVPEYGVIGDQKGIRLYRSVDADPPLGSPLPIGVIQGPWAIEAEDENFLATMPSTEELETMSLDNETLAASTEREDVFDGEHTGDENQDL